MRVLLFRGVGIVSRLIRWQTRSKYSHAAIQLDSGHVIEAWHRGGVRLLTDWDIGHAVGTEVEFFDLPDHLHSDLAEDFLRKELGRKYDWRSVFRFLTRRKAPVNDRWFCSELVFCALRVGGVTLLERIAPGHISPAHLSMSPLLRGTGRKVISVKR